MLPDRKVCQRAMNRMVYNNTDFNVLLRKKTGNWTDATFSFPGAVDWKDMPALESIER